MLVLASAAARDISAWRLHTVRRCLENFKNSRLEEVFFISRHARNDAFAGQGALNEAGLAIVMSKALSPKNQFFDRDFDRSRQLAQRLLKARTGLDTLKPCGEIFEIRRNARTDDGQSRKVRCHRNISQ